MEKTNTQIVKDYLEDVINNKHYENTFNYCSQDCIMLNPPYVGLGFNSDDSSGERIIITEIAQNAPATGKLRVKDELVSVRDGEKKWETFQELKTGGWGWGQGVFGTPVTLTIKRDGQRMEIPMERGRVEGFYLKFSNNMEMWRDYTIKNWPDLKVIVKLTCAENDLVATYLIISGTNQEYHRSAIWDECDIYRLKDGKVVEMWGLENSLVQMKQLGYQIVPPK